MHLKISRISFFAHSENVLVSMLEERYEEVNAFNFQRGTSVAYHIPNKDLVGVISLKLAGKNDHITFCLPKINQDVKLYYTLVILEWTISNTTTSG